MRCGTTAGRECRIGSGGDAVRSPWRRSRVPLRERAVESGGCLPMARVVTDLRPRSGGYLPILHSVTDFRSRSGRYLPILHSVTDFRSRSGRYLPILHSVTDFRSRSGRYRRPLGGDERSLARPGGPGGRATCCSRQRTPRGLNAKTNDHRVALARDQGRAAARLPSSSCFDVNVGSPDVRRPPSTCPTTSVGQSDAERQAILLSAPGAAFVRSHEDPFRHRPMQSDRNR
jgi:hypothetical protein